MEHVWVFCRPGHAGAVAALPIALALKTYRPDCRVTCVVRAISSDILKHQPAVDTVICDPGFTSLLSLFRRETPTQTLFFTLWTLGVAAALVARVPIRFLDRACRGLPSNRHAMASLSLSKATAGRIPIPQTLRALGLPSQFPGRPWVMLTPREKRRALRWFRGVSRPRVLIHPSGLTGSPGLLHTRWNLILGGLGVQEGDLSSLSPWIERGAINLIGKLSLREWLAVLVECDVVISADDESLFLAEAMGVPTVRLDPPSANGELSPVLPEAVPWQVEAVLRHRLRVLGRGVEKPYAGII